MVNLLTMIAAVGILGATIFFVSNQKDSVSLNVKASTNKVVTGTVVSNDPKSCATSFYLGCYQLMAEDGIKYDIVEDASNLSFEQFVGKNVQVVGRQADVKGKNVLMISSINFK